MAQPIGSADQRRMPDRRAGASLGRDFRRRPARSRAQWRWTRSKQRLIDDEAGMIRLLTPPSTTRQTIRATSKAISPGIRENGGQYTHGVLWVVRAMAEMGRGTRAVELLRMLTPVWHTSTAQRGRRLSNRAVRGRGRCLRRAAARRPRRLDLVHRLGRLDVSRRRRIDLRVLPPSSGRTLVINPSISSAWPHCRLTYRLPDGQTRYEITIENPSGNEQGVTRPRSMASQRSSKTARHAFRSCATARSSVTFGFNDQRC